MVIIVPSRKKAEYWSDVSSLELTIENLKDGVERLKSGHVGIAVLINTMVLTYLMKLVVY